MPLYLYTFRNYFALLVLVLSRSSQKGIFRTLLPPFFNSEKKTVNALVFCRGSPIDHHVSPRGRPAALCLSVVTLPPGPLPLRLAISSLTTNTSIPPPLPV